MAKDRDDSSTDLPEDDFPIQPDDIDEVEDIDEIEDIDIDEVVDLEDVDEVVEIQENSDSAVDLGTMTPTEAKDSGDSIGKWADMVDDIDDEDDEPASFDSPSDVDILHQGTIPEGIDDSDSGIAIGDVDVVEDDSGIAVGDVDVVEDVDSGIDVGEVDEVIEVDSGVQLGDEEDVIEVDSGIEMGDDDDVIEVDSGVQLGDDDSAVDLGDEVLEPEVLEPDSATDLSEMIEEEVLDPSDDEIPVIDEVTDAAAPKTQLAQDFDDAPKTQLAPDLGETLEEEIIDLGEPVEDIVDVDDSVEEVDSGVDLDEVIDAGDVIDEVEGSDSGIDLEDVLADDHLPSGDDSSKGSSRDLIAEAVESGTDLDEVEDIDEEYVEDIDEEYVEDIDEEVVVDDDIASIEDEVDLGAAVDIYDSESSVDLGDPGDVTLEELASKGTPKDSDVPIDDDMLDDVEEFGDGEEVAVSVHDAVDDVPSRKSSKKAPKAGRGGLVGGMLAGAGIGVIGCFAAWAFGYEPPESLKTQLGLPAEQQTANNGNGGSGGGAGGGPAAPTPADAAALLRSGNIEQAGRALEKANVTQPDMLALRGEYRMKKYLQSTAQAGGQLSKDDPKLQEAIEDLKNANTPDAQFHLGQIQLLAGNVQEAERLFTEGKTKYPTDRRFPAGLDRIEIMKETNAGNPQTRNLVPFPNTALAYILVALQQPIQPPIQPGGGQPGQPAGEPEPEAGFDFWQAVKLSKQMKYAEALQLLQKARDVHKKMRFLRLGKTQNPDSDPTEEIFIRCCAELEQYWKLQERLEKGGYLAADQKDALQAVSSALAVADRANQASKQLVDEKIIEKPEDLPKGVADLLTKSKQDAKMIADLTKERDNTKRLLAEETTKLVESGKKVKALEKSLLDTTTLVDSAAQELVDAKYLDDKKDKSKLIPGLKMVLKVAAEKDPAGKIMKLSEEIVSLKDSNAKQVAMLNVMHKQNVMMIETKHKKEVAGLKTELDARWEPAQMLEIWRPALLESRNGDLAKKAISDASRVKADPKANAVAKAQAEAIEGIAHRNHNEYDKAKTALQSAKAALDPKSSWQETIADVLAEVSNPAQYHGNRAQKLLASGETKQALAAIDQVLLVVAVKEPLYAKRSLLLLEDALRRHNGIVPLDDPSLAKARADAQIAEQAGLAEGYFAAGRIAEITGQSDVAIAKYREAAKLHPKLDEQGSRYRAALARMLTQSSDEAPLPGGLGFLPLLKNITSRLARADKQDASQVLADLTKDEKSMFLAMISVMFQAPWEGLDANRDEAVKLADEILAADPKTVSFEARAQAFAIKGQWTKALETMSEGLTKSLRRDQAELLRKLIDQHPALKRERQPTGSNPVEAEKRYGEGLRHFFARNYVEAEKSLKAAIELNDQDARYFYFLGLASMTQGKPKTAEYFERGARLEQQGQPGRQAVSRSLERVQGQMRQVLNLARDRFRDR